MPFSSSFSALGRAVWDETRHPPPVRRQPKRLSVLSVEPYGMKRYFRYDPRAGRVVSFSALGRAVWDETLLVVNGYRL